MLKTPHFSLSCQRSAVFLALSSLLFAHSALAQVDAGALQQNLEKQLPLPSPLALPDPTDATPSESRVGKEGEVRFTVNSFVLEGISILPEAEVQLAIRSWIGVPVSFEDLQRACDAIQALYRSKGYTVQAILPPQKIANGVVKILITEAKLGKVIVDNPQGPTRFSKELAAEYIAYANPIGDPLNMSSLERAIIILNETPGVMVASQLEAGDKDGDTNVRLQLTQPDLIQGRAEINNYGSRTTGAPQAIASLNFNGPFGIGDSASINGVFSEGSQYIQGAIALPGSKDGLRLGLAATYLNYKNLSNNAETGGEGDAWTTGLSAAYPLIRSHGGNLNTSFNYDYKSYSNRNSIFDAVFSAYNINNLSAGLSGNIVDSLGYGAISSGSVTAVLGNLNITDSGPFNYSAYPSPTTNLYQRITPANFGKLTFAANRNQQLVEDGATTLYAAISGQFSTTNLNSAEQFYLGGPYGVRAYPVAQSGGSQGGLLTVELRHQIQPKLTVSAFFDGGMVQQYKTTYPQWQGLTNAANTYSLMGAGLGLKWEYEGWNLGAMVAWKVGQNPLYNQFGQAVDTDGTTTQPRGWLTGSYNF
jgi:hemolysin activation/secretion protein